MKIAFKGFNENLQCKGEQFEVGKTYAKPQTDNKPRLCSSEGFHYCNELENVYSYYNLDGKNRFCKIEVVGSFNEDTEKGITTSFRIIEEIPKKELLSGKIEKNIDLDTVKLLQTKYPLLHIGGSIGLYLHGVRLDRWAFKESDFDFITPYYFVIEPDDNLGIVHIDSKPSANDFDETMILNGRQLDLRVDPKQRYEIIEHNGFKYKVSLFETIMEAKMRYSMNGQNKHRDDIREMCGVVKKVVPVENSIKF